MLRLNRRQRHILADKLPDVANLAAAGLIFAQFVSGQRFSAVIAIAGLAVWAGFIAVALWLAREGEES